MEAECPLRARQTPAWLPTRTGHSQAAEQEELAKLEAEGAMLRAQRAVQSQQLEELKARILAER
jgi:hypothetical protein